MHGVINRLTLPPKLQDEGLAIVFSPALDIEDYYVEQLIEKSRQPHIIEFEGPEDIGTAEAPGRFRSMQDYQNWATNKKRFMFLLINPSRLVGPQKTPEVGGVSWFGKREHSLAPGRTVTFAMRNYAADERRDWAQYAGRGLAGPFMREAHRVARDIYPAEGLWLDLVAGNEASRKMCVKSGYEEITRFKDADHGGQTRVVMVNDSAFDVASDV